MESNEKTFRYSQIQSLVVFYLMFLILCVVAGFFVGIREFMFFGLLMSIGIILLIRDGSSALSINPRMDGSVEIFDLLYSKRPDLFSIKKNNPLLRNDRSDLITLTIGVLLVILSFFLLYSRISYLDITLGLLGL